jgi:hypothetical protein
VTGSLRVSGSIGVIGSGSDVLSVYGSQGNLLIATDTFSGSIFTVTDISGYPILDITSDYYTNHIEMIGTASLTGSLSITQDLTVGQNVTASKALFSSSNNNQLMVIGSGSSSWITGIYGSQGNLLTVTDTFSGSLFTITDISGYTILDITSDYYTSHIEMIGTASLTGSLSVTQDVTASKALLSSSRNNQLMVIGSGSSSWIAGVYGSQGNLLTVTDTFSGSIFVASDISGYPILKVTSDYYTGSVFLPMMQSQSQQHVIVYNSASGLLTYVSTSSIGGGSGGGISFPYTITSSAVVPIFRVSGSLYFEVGRDGGTERLFRMTYDEVDPGVIVEMGGIGVDTVFTVNQFLKTINIDAATASIQQLTDVPQTNVITIDTLTGQLFYTASSAIGGGGSGIPGGLNRQIQFNANGTSFSGSSNFTFDSASNALLLTGSLTISGSNAFTNIGPATFTGSLFVSGAVSASFGSNTVGFFGTSSWAQSASKASTASLVSVTNEPSPGIPQVRYLTYVYNSGSGQSLITTGSLAYNHQLNIIFATASQAYTASFLSPLKQNLIVSGNIIPGGPYVSNTSSYNLGSPTAAWDKIYVSNNSLHFVSGSTSASIGFNNGAIDFGSASVSLPVLTTAPQQYIVTYNSESGQLFYTASSAIGGGGPSTFNSTSSFLGNGLSSSFNINHGFNTLNLHITVYSASGTYETVYPDIRRVNANTASIVFANPPASNEYIVYISQ